MFDNINFINIEFFFNLVLEFFRGLTDLFSTGFYFIDPFLVKLVTVFLSCVVALGIFYAWYMKKTILKELEEKFEVEIDEFMVKDQETVENQRWQDILGHLDNSSINSWTIAIIEADKMLDDALTRVGAIGDSIGEKLKTISLGDLPSLDEAWSAHKLRNRIAHETGFVLTQKDARDAVKNYESALKDLGYL